MISRLPQVCRLGCAGNLFFTVSAVAQAAPEVPDITKVPAAAQPSDHFDVNAATDAYLDLMPASAKARSDAYFEGGYWLILWDFLLGAVIALLLLNLGWSAWMRNLAERITNWKWLQTFIYWVQYLLLTTVLGFPMAVYEGYFREWKYGLATQTFGPWMWDQVKGLGLERAAGRHLRGGAVLGGAQAAAHLVDLGRSRHRRY